MKVKKLLIATLVLVISFVSCQNTDEVNDGVLTDVVLSPIGIKHETLQTATTTSAGVDSETKLAVMSGGLTEWHENDEVFLVDMIGVPRTFTADTEGTSSRFTGKLLAGRGSQTYYAYYPAKYSPCQLNVAGGKRLITVSRKQELEYHSNDATNGIRKGEHCAMIGLPLTFEAENSGDFKDFSFYHASTLIEAHVRRNIGGYDLGKMKFNKVIFTVQAIDPSDSETVFKPFNTEVTFDMKEIEYVLKGQQYTKVKMPLFSEGREKLNMMTTTLTYDDNTTFEERMTQLSNYYDIHIFALPTSIDFKYIADVYFYNDEEIVCHLQYKGIGIANGLNPGALNIIDFNAVAHIVQGPVI